MKNYLNIFLTGIVVCLTLSTIKGFRDNQTSNEKIEAAKGPTSDPNILKNLFYDNYITSIVSNDGKGINPNLNLKDTALAVTTLKKIIGQKNNTLIFRFSYQDCDECVKQILNSLKKTFKGDLSNKVVIITDVYSDRDFVLKAKSQNYPFSIYSIDNPGLGLSLENKNLPFLFVLSGNRVIKPFIPFKEFPAVIDEYNENIKAFISDTINQTN